MNEDDRPNPEDLLQVIKKEEKQKRKGKLKIFLGMAAGVGKTYAMLEAAQKLQREGVNLVIGTIDTHGRQETARLLEGLRVIPEKWVKYKDSVFEELDLDTILKEQPKLVLVDELAHSNVPGSRHPKRWQDVMEMLDHGIDVYTTLNVQHIESLKDLIEKITGIVIRETVPDMIIDQAGSIELIDLTPGDLLQRLREGKVYLGDQSIIAARNFFQEDRLTALREIVLRYTAEKVEHDLLGMVSSVERPEGWKLRERLMVAISPSPHSQKLIRITRRLAFNLDAPWIAVHVDDGRPLNAEDQETLAKNIALARDLGAEVITTSDSDIAQALQRIARQKSVTQIIIGRPPKRWLFDFFQVNTLMDRLAKECSDIDLHVIRQTLFPKSFRRSWTFPKTSSNFASYLFAGVVVIASAMLGGYLLNFVSYRIVGFLFLLAILTLGLFLKKGPIFFASSLFALIWIYFFLPEEELYEGASGEDYLLLSLYLLTAMSFGTLIDRARRNKEMLLKREKTTEILYDIVKDIASAGTQKDVLSAVKESLQSALDGRCEIILKSTQQGLEFDPSIPAFNNEKEKAAADWVYKNGREAGWSTSTLPFSQHLYIPLKGANEVVGVLAYQPKRNHELSVEEKNFLYTVGQQLTNYLERSLSEEKERQYEKHQQIEKIYQSTLNLISNLFEGPLLTIQDAAKDLKNTDIPPKLGHVLQPIEQICLSSENLMRILDNVTAMINLNAGVTPVNRTRNNFANLIKRCSGRIKKMAEHYQWKLSIQENLPDISYDSDLIELVFYNLAFHAMEFTPPASQIEVAAKISGDYVSLSISGEGQSIPPDMIDVAFEKFYRVPGTISGSNASQGLGLGLAIAKTIAEIHNGQLSINNRPEGGMVFTLFLPIV